VPDPSPGVTVLGASDVVLRGPLQPTAITAHAASMSRVAVALISNPPVDVVLQEARRAALCYRVRDAARPAVRYGRARTGPAGPIGAGASALFRAASAGA